MKNEGRRTLNPSGIGSDEVHRLSEHWEDGRRAKRLTDQPEVLICKGGYYEWPRKTIETIEE